MKVALTGTPGTGKSTIAGLVGAGFKVVRVNELIKEGYDIGMDEERNCLIADLPKLSGYVKALKGDVILEGHTSHLSARGRHHRAAGFALGTPGAAHEQGMGAKPSLKRT